MYNNQRLAKKKTRLKKRTLNPVFNESFLFDVPLEGLENVSLEFQVSLQAIVTLYLYLKVPSHKNTMTMATTLFTK